MSLTDFQLHAATKIYTSLFKEQTTSRFLLADEVGLGKTRVAQEVIRQLWANNPRNPIRVYYVCNNLTLAEQNKSRLVPDDLKKSTWKTMLG